MVAVAARRAALEPGDALRDALEGALPARVMLPERGGNRQLLRQLRLKLRDALLSPGQLRLGLGAVGG